MQYARVVKGTLYLSSEFGAIEDGTWHMTMGYYDPDTGTVYVNPGLTIGGVKMAKYARERVMFFGSWTGEAIPESATVDIGDSTGITACIVVATTFGATVNQIPGEYVFTYDGTGWMLNGNAVTDIATKYGLTVTGDPAKGDILVVTYTAAAGAWEALGKDNDDLSKELNPDVETSKNVLGETTVTHSGYEPEVGVDPYYIDPSRKMYKHLAEVAIEEKYDEANVLGYFAEAHFTTANPETKKMTGFVYIRQAYFVPQSVGGDTSGWAIPVNIYPIGAVTKKKIVYDMPTNEATITDIT